MTIDFRVWSDAFNAALSGLSARPGFSDDEIIARAGVLAELAHEAYQIRITRHLRDCGLPDTRRDTTDDLRRSHGI